MESTLKSGTRLVLAIRLVWKASRGWTIWQFGLVAAQGLLPLAGLVVLKRIVDAVSGAIQSNRDGAFAAVVPWLIVAGAIALATSLCRSLSELAQEHQSALVTEHVSRILHEQSIAVDLAYYEDPQYHDTLHRAQREAGYRPTRIVSGLIQIGQSGLALAGIIVLLISLDWLVGILLLAAAFPGMCIRLLFSKRLFSLQKEQTARQRRSWYYNWLVTSLQHAAVVRLLGIGPLFSERAVEMREQLNTERLRLSRSRVLAETAGQTLATAAVFGALAVICYKTVSGHITLGGLAMYYQGFQSGLGFLQNLLRGLAGLYEDSLFLGDFQDFLAIEPRIRPSVAVSACRPSLARAGDAGIYIRLEKVSFAYSGSTSRALDGIDFELQPGKIVAIAGENGAGKSTLVKLLARLYDPDDGRILVNDIDLRQLDPVEWRTQISVVSQDYAGFHLTARENIWAGNVSVPASTGRIELAARLSGADRIIEKLPARYESLLGRQFEHGVDISAGEWQRLAIARALFREAPLLVLDEPTSSLDPFSEADFLIRLRDIIGNRTTLLVSHRFSALRLADLICVMQEGRLVEAGTHDDLISNRGHYARLFQVQEGLFAAPSHDRPQRAQR